MIAPCPPYQHLPHRQAFATIRVTLIASLVLACTGCNILGPVAVMLKGPEKVPAQYQLQNQYTAILVDDPDDVLQNPSLRAVIASNVEYHVERNLGEDSGQRRSKQYTAGFVPQGEIANLISQLGPQRYADMPIDEIGRRLGASQVIYIRMGGFGVPNHIALDRPTAQGYVKVIDVTERRRLFPGTEQFASEATGVPVGAELEGNYNTREIGIGRQIRRELAQKLGLEISRLFYQWTRDDIGNSLPG